MWTDIYFLFSWRNLHGILIWISKNNLISFSPTAISHPRASNFTYHWVVNHARREPGTSRSGRSKQESYPRKLSPYFLSHYCSHTRQNFGPFSAIQLKQIREAVKPAKHSFFEVTDSSPSSPPHVVFDPTRLTNGKRHSVYYWVRVHARGC